MKPNHPNSPQQLPSTTFPAAPTSVNHRRNARRLLKHPGMQNTTGKKFGPPKMDTIQYHDWKSVDMFPEDHTENTRLN